MRIRLLADGEPYASYPSEKDPSGSFSFCREAGERADLAVMPAEAFLALAPEARPESPVFAYGPVRLMAAAFAAGCRDYLREPWSLAELRARAERYEVLRFRAGEADFELRERFLALSAEPERPAKLGEAERKLLRLLILNAGAIVPRRALARELGGQEKEESRVIDVRVARLRGKLDSLATGSGRGIKACRGLGYRLDVDNCG
ncbi:MAG TPA: winged helix-turn-helix domain-containing protein [Spirochaetales bacterium]|nr:winged helix-turn-helix domain-containing protein [Spirochaetales bacterium]HRY54154.1 winged helix-turn-helix domain-containing protein [Spirochaetia bacterium]